MDFAFSEKSLEMQRRVRDFMESYVHPRTKAFYEQSEKGNFPPAFLEDLKALAKSEGLWNLFLPGLKPDEPGTKLTNLEYAPCAEIMGKVYWASEVFNCSAPDTGNMELLHLFASPMQRERWLNPLLNGEIRSAYSMTEPDVASSDATNIQTRISRDGNEWVINGRKWFSTGATHPNCTVFIVMGVSDPDAERHRRHAMVIVPKDTPGLTVVRNVPIMHHTAPEGHCEVRFDNVRVPVDYMLGEPGSGFALAQARLGPGRVHHCMRSIGMCEVAVDLMVQRALERKTFGKYLHEHGIVADWIAQSRCEIDQARLLVLRTAWLMDQQGNKAARKEVAMIKVVVPKMQTTIVNRGIQLFGAMGLTPDTPLAFLWTWGRALQIVDGPDEVHKLAIAKQEVRAAQERLKNNFIDYETGLPATH